MPTDTKNKRLRTLIDFLKIEDTTEFLAVVLIAAIIANGSIFLPHFELLMLALGYSFLLIVGAIILNQYYDLEVDKINKPYRPLPSNKISLGTAKRTVIICYITSFIISLYLGSIYPLITLAAILVAMAYSYPPLKIRKNLILPGILENINYSVITFMIGWSLYNPLYLIPWWLILFFFVSDIGANFAKDYRDFIGDKKYGIATLPTKYGYKKAAKYNLLIYALPFVVLLISPILTFLDKRFILLSIYCIVSGALAFLAVIKSNQNDRYSATLCYRVINTNILIIRIVSGLILIT